MIESTFSVDLTFLIGELYAVPSILRYSPGLVLNLSNKYLGSGQGMSFYYSQQFNL